MDYIFRPKLFSLLKQGLERKQVIKDIFSGIIVGIVALPLAIAFGVASGVTPEKGIITAIIAGFIVSVFGGSRVQIAGPTGAFIVIVFGIIQEYGFDGLLISTVLAGIILVLFGIFKLGSLLKFIPHPMVVGFTSGIALVILTTQIKDALGLEISNLPSEFVGKWSLYFQSLGSINYFALAVTLTTIIIVLLGNRFISLIPGSFIAIIIVTVGVYIFDLPVVTIEDVFGTISTKISIDLPAVDFSNLSNYIVPAITIALLGAIESLLSAVVADGMISGNHRSNTELIAQGLANIVVPFFGGIPATGAIARTATNIKNGGRTPISGVIHAITLLLILVFFGRWAKLIPMSCLAGVLIIVVYNMSEWRSFISVFKSSKFDILILLTTFFLTVFVDLTVAIEVGIVLSSILFMKRMSEVGKKIPSDIDSDIIDRYENLPPAVNVFEISGPFFFASAKHYYEAIKIAGLKSNILIIRMRHVPFIDSTGCQNFKTAISAIKKQGVKVLLSGVNPDVMKELQKSRISFLVGKNNIFTNFDDSVQYAKKLLESNQAC